MGKIIINNYSKVRDDKVVLFAVEILAGMFSEDFLSDAADNLGIDVGIRTDDETGEKTFTVTDRD